MKILLARKRLFTMMLVASASLMGGCGSDDDSTTVEATPIPFELGDIITNYYDGISDGLLGGLGLSGIQGAAPGYVDAANPTKAELRKNTIFVNYGALVSQTDGLFGVKYGPTNDTKYAGHEYLAFVGEGFNRATLMVQVPDSFNVEAPCIVAAPSSGSRGVYGAIGTGGAWGIEKGCAVAYTDMNKGTGAVDLTQGKGYGIQHDALDLTTDEELTFRIPTQENVSDPSADYAGVELPTDAQVAAYITEKPNRYAFKQTHSQKNTEKDWGLHTLQSIKFAFRQLNNQFPQTQFTPENTLVIAASVSNGGAGVLRAAEQDTESLIDAVVAGEPNINPQASSQEFSIKMGERAAVVNHSKPGIEYWTVSERYAACASEAEGLKGTLLTEARGAVAPRCDAMVAAGLLTAISTEAPAHPDLAAEEAPSAEFTAYYSDLGAQSLAKLKEAGYLEESNKLLVGYAGIDLFQSLTNTYASSYSRVSLVKNLCDISMAWINPENKAAANPALATLATHSNGIPRTGSTANDIYLVKDDALGGAHKQSDATSANGTKDYNFTGAECLYDLYFNAENSLNARLKQGVSEIQASGDLQGKPTIIVHGRNDALIAVNHSSRPYYALSKISQGNDSAIHYYEVTNAQHLDTLNWLYNLGGMYYVPIDYYFKKSMDLMYDHLKNGTALPASQVVKAKAPTEGVLALTDLIDIEATPNNPITFNGTDLVIPE